jgi:hypothetical protein
MFNCLPNDPKIAEMDDLIKTWMFFSWLEDKDEEHNLFKNLGCLIGYFWNPKAAREMLGYNEGEKISVSEEDFDKSVKYVETYKKDSTKKRRKKKISFDNLKE